MEAGVPSVMVSHIITALDPERPASVSAKVVDYIRSNMGYDGVLSIEHEDYTMDAMEGIQKTVALLKNNIPYGG